MASATASAGSGKNLLPGKQLISQRQRAWNSFKRNKSALIGLIMIIGLVILAVFAPWIAPHDPLEQSVINKFKPPSAENLLGTDNYGRNIMSRIIWGTRVALEVGIYSVIIGAVIGITIGVVAAYFGGITDSILMRLIDIMLSFPDLITGLLVMAVLGAGKGKLIIAIGLTIAPRFARIAYGPVLGLKEKEFVEAARAIGQSTPRILRTHILPNIAGEMIVLGSLWTASAIRLEASLSFIGLGVPPPTPTWGQMIRDGTVRLADLPLLSLAPGAALLIAVFAFNLVGDGLRDILDPRSK